MSDVRASWIDGSVMPDEAVVAETLANIADISAPWVALMEVTVGRGKELGGETPVNPSMSEDQEAPGVFERYIKVHSDWDRYLLWGFKLAPVANHDNHMANWGAGHTTRTAVVAEGLSESSVLDALRTRAVYATEDEDTVIRLYADQRVAMGGTHRTLASSVKLSLQVSEGLGGASGHDVSVYLGRVGGNSVDVAATTATTSGAWQDLDVDLPEAGRWFMYLEVHDPNADRMSWSAPIWVERLESL
jgi:hypothetical protein